MRHKRKTHLPKNESLEEETVLLRALDTNQRARALYPKLEDFTKSKIIKLQNKRIFFLENLNKNKRNFIFKFKLIAIFKTKADQIISVLEFKIK